MKDMKITKITAPAVPLLVNDIDTDRIIPARYLRTVSFDGLTGHAFEDDRKQEVEQGRVHPFDDPRFAKARILLTAKNFGCGSSREHAPQALRRWNRGIAAIVAESFAEIFFGNCVTLGIACVTASAQDIARLAEVVQAAPDTEVCVDLEELSAAAGDVRIRVAMPEGPRQQLLQGRWDPTAELLAAKDQIAQTAATIPYFRWSPR